jgi:hypothetical protein
METTNEKRRFPKDHIVFDWFGKVRNKNIPISESVLKENNISTLKVQFWSFPGIRNVKTGI